MIVNDCVLDLKRYWSPYGSVAPAAGWPDISRYQTDMIDGAGAAAPDWMQLPSGLWVKEFDGSDYCSLAVADWRPFDYRGTMAFWFKTSIVAGDKVLFATSDTATDTSFIRMYIRATRDLAIVTVNSGGIFNAVRSSSDVVDGAWHFGVVISSGTAWSIATDGVLNTNPTIISGANTGDWFGDILLRDNLSLGALIRTGVVFNYNGPIALPCIYSYVLTPDQINAKYQSERHWFDGA